MNEVQLKYEKEFNWGTLSLFFDLNPFGLMKARKINKLASEVLQNAPDSFNLMDGRKIRREIKKKYPKLVPHLQRVQKVKRVSEPTNNMIRRSRLG